MHGRGPANDRKAKNFKGTLKTLINYLSVYKFKLLIVFIFSVASSVFAIFGPKILGKATTEIYVGISAKLSGTGGINFKSLGNILILLLVLYIISLICSFIQNFIMSGVSERFSYRLRKSISEKIDKLPMSYFDKVTHGEILSRVTNDVDIISNNLNQSITQIITAITTMIGIFIMMISINIPLTIVGLLTIPFSLIWVTFIVRKSQKYYKKGQEYLGHVNGVVEEMYSGHNIVKVFNGEEEAIKNFDSLNNVLYESSWKSQFLSGLMMPMMRFISNLGYVGVCILGGILAFKKSIEVGDILSFVQYVKRFNQPLQEVSQIASVIQSTVAAGERVFEFLDEEEEVKNVKKPLSCNNIKGDVEFRHVKFGYNEDKIIINDFSAKLKSGQKIAIVGPTGAGKTTLVKLLMRFYDVTDGEILIDGHNIKEFDRSELRRNFGMVLQDAWVYTGTIKENIKYGKLEATDEEIIEACKAAHVHHFIKTLPDGYDMEINEDSNNISQGQKQLLTIARVILINPKMLILDEATSSVDTRTELLIQKAMDKLMENRTSFIIAHRLSTIKNADLILVMNNGDIIEQGTHNELLAQNGFYSSLYNSQFEQ